jgi:uncharacterized protein YbjQ (UPF0145 family)
VKTFPTPIHFPFTNMAAVVEPAANLPFIHHNSIKSLPLTTAKVVRLYNSPQATGVEAMNIIEAHQTATSDFSAIGRITATSAWHGQTLTEDGYWRDVALRELKRCAEDVDADAIVDVSFALDGLKHNDLGEIVLQRVCAMGTAVRYKAAA